MAKLAKSPESTGEYFDEVYGFDDEDRDVQHLIITLIYFSFTSLSTVGFGDLHPKSDAERLICAFVLMMGVAIFSIVMSNFQEILDKIRSMNADIGDSEGLGAFF